MSVDGLTFTFTSTREPTQFMAHRAVEGETAEIRVADTGEVRRGDDDADLCRASQTHAARPCETAPLLPSGAFRSALVSFGGGRGASRRLELCCLILLAKQLQHLLRRNRSADQIALHLIAIQLAE